MIDIESYHVRGKIVTLGKLIKVDPRIEPLEDSWNLWHVKQGSHNEFCS